MAIIQRRKTYTAAIGRRARRRRRAGRGAVDDQHRHRRYRLDRRRSAALARAGSELVRVTVNNEAAAAAVPHIVEELEPSRACACPSSATSTTTDICC